MQVREGKGRKKRSGEWSVTKGEREGERERERKKGREETATSKTMTAEIISQAALLTHSTHTAHSACLLLHYTIAKNVAFVPICPRRSSQKPASSVSLSLSLAAASRHHCQRTHNEQARNKRPKEEEEKKNELLLLYGHSPLPLLPCSYPVLFLSSICKK
jgi:hypothetical protein